LKKAFLNLVLQVIEAMHPEYLAIGVESNVLLSRNPAKWTGFSSCNETPARRKGR
jgi:hypothetical protein